jgi:hypothetical protein
MMMKNLNVGRSRKPTATQTAGTAQPAGGSAAKGSETATGAGGYDPTKSPSATNMPPQAGSKGPQPSAGAGKVSGNINENIFRVFGLAPARNPFVRKEEWFREDLEQLPGYPELRDSGYFDTMENTVPKSILDSLPGDNEWESIEVQKTHTANTYAIEGTSEDGLINTSIKATAATPDPVDISWFGGSGVPLDELSVPGWEERYDLPQSSAAAPPGSVDDSAGVELPELGNGATGVGGGLPSPDDVMQGGPGDALYCHGINLQNGRKSALITFNGQPYIVGEGSVLPTHYQVMEIKSDGVLLLELRDGSSVFLPLQAPKPPAPTR